MGAAGKDGESQRAELAAAADQIERALAAVLTTQAPSGVVTDRNNQPTGHWTYSPSAPH
jgi:hypothetical protein